MKRMNFFVVLAVLAALLSVGCSNSPLSALSPEINEQETATANLVIVLREPGSLGKRTEFYAPEFIVLYIAGASTGASNIPVDTIFIASGQTVMNLSIPGFVRGEKYHVGVQSYNNNYFYQEHLWNLNYGSEYNFIVPNSESFVLALELDPLTQRLRLIVPLQGTPAEAIACSIKVTWSTPNLSGPPYRGEAKKKFAPGSLAMAVFEETMVFPITEGLTLEYTIGITVYNNDGSYWEGQNVVAVTNSTNSSLNIPLSFYGGNGRSLGKISVTLGLSGITTVTSSYE